MTKYLPLVYGGADVLEDVCEDVEEVESLRDVSVQALVEDLLVVGLQMNQEELKNSLVITLQHL
jgi:hypothetical protein